MGKIFRGTLIAMETRRGPRPKPPEEVKISTSVRIPAYLLRQFRPLASARGDTLSGVAEDAVAKYIAKNGPPRSDGWGTDQPASPVP